MYPAFCTKLAQLWVLIVMLRVPIGVSFSQKVSPPGVRGSWNDYLVQLQRPHYTEHRWLMYNRTFDYYNEGPTGRDPNASYLDDTLLISETQYGQCLPGNPW
ncbi:hypothetical protein F4604DRAFT_1686371 [Suillus subluteus]|nr:hypothetical protein F4604DRAFT_1686371 [Suillus subluteus]